MNDDPEQGVGVIELIVGMVVSTIVLIGVATVLFNALIAQEDVTTTSEATTRGQLISSGVERAMRNALRFTVSGPDGSELRVWTTLAGSQACQGFRLVDGGAQMTVNAGPLASPVMWPSWEQDVSQRSGGTGPVPFFTESVPGTTITYAFDIQTRSAPVRFDGEVSVRSTQGDEDDNPCW